MTGFCWGAFAGALPFTVLAVVVVLAVTFGFAVRLGRHSVIDTAWGLGFVVVAAAAFGLSTGSGDVVRRSLLLVLTAVWGIRLAVHIGIRARGHGEDPRYDEMLDRAPGNRTVYALTHVYLTQGVAMWFISLPVQIGMFEVPSVGWIGWLGVAVWAVGIFFETVGDWQLTRFRSDPGSRGKVLDTGLWHYTRHPNYFGDACVWWGLSLLAFDAWPGIVTVLSPLAMTWLLAKGTGKPLLEKGMASRRPGYAEYVRRTSGFVPLPPRRRATDPSTGG
jgi:steroid 5-alpha reductase family enzyme